MTVEAGRDDAAVAPLQFDDAGLMPVVVQDDERGDVLLLAFMNAEALRLTLAERRLVLWSRSRGRLWRKGEQSGHRLWLRELRLNCEGTSLLARVRLEGAGACHQGYYSCFYRSIQARADGTPAVNIVEERVFDPAVAYGESTAAAIAPETPLDFAWEARALYQAYERLRDGNVTEPSSTASLLRMDDAVSIARWAVLRSQQELAELRGVIDGRHRHQGGVEDVILEASQVSYWAIVAAVAARAAFDDWRPDAAWLAGYDGDERPPASGDETLTAAARLLWAAGAICREAGVHPRQVIAADLVAMRTKHPELWDGSPTRKVVP